MAAWPRIEGALEGEELGDRAGWPEFGRGEGIWQGVWKVGGLKVLLCRRRWGILSANILGMAWRGVVWRWSWRWIWDSFRFGGAERGEAAEEGGCGAALFDGVGGGLADSGELVEGELPLEVGLVFAVEGDPCGDVGAGEEGVEGEEGRGRSAECRVPSAEWGERSGVLARREVAEEEGLVFGGEGWECGGCVCDHACFLADGERDAMGWRGKWTARVT